MLDEVPDTFAVSVAGDVVERLMRGDPRMSPLDCYWQGSVVGDEASRVVMSTCGAAAPVKRSMLTTAAGAGSSTAVPVLRGSVMAHGEHLYIEPAAPHRNRLAACTSALLAVFGMTPHRHC